MQCGVYRERTDHTYKKRTFAVCCTAFMALLLLPLQMALAADASVATQEDLLAALEAEPPMASIKLSGDLVTDANIALPEGTVVDMEGFSWTVESGTVAVLPTSVVGGTFTAGKNGTIRVLTSVALESASAGEQVKSVTYTDGEKDDSANYIAGHAVHGDFTAKLYLKQGKTVKRVTTAQASYRLGTADETRLSLVYAIAYNLDGGRIENGQNPTEYTASDAAITLAPPTKEGYTFLGWTGTGLTAPTESVTIPMRSTGNRSYTAIWEESELPAGGTGSGTGGSRPSGGGSTNGGSLSFSVGMSTVTDTEETEAAKTATESPIDAAPQSQPSAQQSSRRLSVASSDVSVEFHGARPAVETVTAGDVPPRIDLPRILVGAVLLLLALAGAILLHKKRD